MTRYVFIGNSMAAHSAATRIHSLDPRSPITFVTDEPYPYYSRCALMYYVMEHCWKRDIFIADDEHYRRLNAELVFDTVIGVDTSQREVLLLSGQAMGYDKLCVCTGAAPRRLGVPNEDAEGVQDFIRLEDADSILRESAHAKRAVVIGGGLIGAEAAEVFHELEAVSKPLRVSF